ncbi:MAG: type I-C CRISPR-associated protein Cas8c/Csd1 [Clostridia bacterium]|nr:type I-C CRISPR-associated protein Cas8c/Csd1 [Clostridia bacterium]
MGLFKNLIEFYDKQINDKNSTLPPLYHDYKSVNNDPLLVVTLNEDGYFISAEQFSRSKEEGQKIHVGKRKEDKSIIIPVNGKSFARSGKKAQKAMHAVFDLLEYFDFENNKEGMGKYIKNLENWCNSDYSHPKINSLLKYIKCGTLKEDIKNTGLDLNKKWFLLFEVVGNKDRSDNLSKDDGESDELWQNKVVRKRYTDYYENCVLGQNEFKEICYIMGNEDLATKDFFKFLGNSKLISANDGTNFTYRGRFLNDSEAFSIGIHANQKFSLALKWLIENQGFTIGESKFVLWENQIFSKKVPNRPWESTLGIYENNFESYSTGNKVYLDDFMKAAKTLKAPRKDLKNGIAKMNILILEAPGKGRMSIRYYREILTEEYLDNILKWHKEGFWEHFKYIKEDKNSKKSKKIIFEGMPSILDIVKYAYGNERENGFIEIEKDKFFGVTVAKLLPCVIEGKKIPKSIVEQLIYKASNRQCYKSYINWESVLRATCSCVKKYWFENNKGEYKMALDENITDRNYLYGRLLAVADKIEKAAQYKKNDKNVNETNAGRYMSAFSQRPFKTWEIIEKRLRPYLVSLSSGSRAYYGNLLDLIHSKFKTEDYKNDKKLDGLYLLGYHCQMIALNIKNNENTEGDD